MNHSTSSHSKKQPGMITKQEEEQLYKTDVHL